MTETHDLRVDIDLALCETKDFLAKSEALKNRHVHNPLHPLGETPINLDFTDASEHHDDYLTDEC